MRLVRAEEQEVAVDGARALEHAGDRRIRQKLQDRRLQAVAAFRLLVDLDVREPLGAVAADERRVVVDLLARELAALRQAQCRDPALRIRSGAREYLELDALEKIGDLDELERVAQVRLVASVATHRVRVRHARERFRQLDAEHRLEQVAQQLLHERHDVLFGHERRLDIELRELGLTVRAQVFVAEALHDLIVAVEARDHQQLLHELRRLRQREEVAGLRAARDQIVARALGRRLAEHRRLDVDEAVLVHELAQRASDGVAQTQVAHHLGAAQIEIAVTQPHLFRHRLVVVERRRLRLREHVELRREQLDLATRQIRIDRARGPLAHAALHREHELAAQPLGLGKHRGAIGIEHDLEQTFAVPQVDEDHAAVIAAAVHPTGNANLAPDQRAIHLPAVMTAHRQALYA